jgi:predicted nucleotidyltransferase
MVDESIVESVRRYLAELEKQAAPVRFGVVFGSQAQGTADQWSDIDLLVVSPRFDQQRNRDDINLLWRVAARMDSRIEPIPVGQQEYDEDDSSAIVEIARREGQVISLVG